MRCEVLKNTDDCRADIDIFARIDAEVQAQGQRSDENAIQVMMIGYFTSVDCYLFLSYSDCMSWSH
jgi:hypothetical protein